MGIFQAAQKGVAALFVAAAGWLACVGMCASVTIQRHLCYLHKLPIWWRQRLHVPESFGFLHNQVLPMHIPTSDGDKLYAWLVSPLALYAQHEKDFLCQTTRYQDDSDIAIKLLNDPKSQLVIYLHGNAGTVGQTRRTDAYRMITSGSSEQTHVLAFDYRGFGYSTGHPTEAALIDDALSVIKWARTVGKVSTDRIVILAQSLGTGVATGALHAIIKETPTIKFAGLCLCATFPDAATVFFSYRLGGIVPLLYPLRLLPSLQTWLSARIRDKWLSRQRLGDIVRVGMDFRLVFIAATCDEVIPWKNTQELFHAVVAEATETGNDADEIDEITQITDLEEGGETQEWKAGQKCIRKVIVKYGGKCCYVSSKLEEMILSLTLLKATTAS